VKDLTPIPKSIPAKVSADPKAAKPLIQKKPNDAPKKKDEPAGPVRIHTDPSQKSLT